MKKQFLLVKRIISIIFIASLLTACSSSIKNDVLKAIKDSSIEDSYIAYDNRNERWYNFKDQEEDVQELYLEYLDKTVEFISELELEEAEVNELKPEYLTTIKIKVIQDDHDYMLHITYKWANTLFYKFSIDKKEVYYKLDGAKSNELSKLITSSEYAPFQNISFYDYLDHENK